MHEPIAFSLTLQSRYLNDRNSVEMANLFADNGDLIYLIVLKLQKIDISLGM